LTAIIVGLAGSRALAKTPEYTVLSRTADRHMVQLPNGLVVIAQHITGAPVASVQVWVRTGSIYERQHNGAGLSHFLEHLLAGGSTTNRTEEQTNQVLGSIGAQTNAATSLDNVHYYIDTSSAHAATAIELMSDWMLNSTISQTEYERERSVIQREFDMGRGEPNRIFWKATQQACFRYHPARHPTIGYIDEFLKITRDEIYNFYRQMYVPNNMVFSVAGEIDPQAVVDQVAKLWAGAKRSTVPPVLFPVEPVIEEPSRITGHADIDRPRLRMVWPGTEMGTHDDYALDLLAGILGDGELSRLVQSVRNRQGLVTSVDAYNQSFAWGRGFFGIDATVSADKLDQAHEAILAEVARLATVNVTDEELDRAKRKTLSAVIFAAQSANATASRVASDFLRSGNPDYLDHYAREIQKVTAADVQSVAHRFLKSQRLITITLMPSKGEPQDPARPADVEGVSKVPSELVELDNAGLVAKYRHLPAADKLAAATKIERSKVTMHTLANGLRVLIQRDTRLPIVAMQWYHLGGLMADEPGREGVANAMSTMMMKGAGGQSADEIARQLESLGADVGASIGNSTFYVNGQSLAADWPTVLGIMADVILRPEFPDDQWQLMQPRLLAAIDSINDSWYSQLRVNFTQTYFGDGHPWASPQLGRRDVVQSLTTEQLRKFHADHFGARPGVLAIFGDVDEKQVIARVTELFGSMPAEPAVKVTPPVRGSSPGGYVVKTTNKPLTAVQIGWGPGMPRQSPDYAPALVMNRVLDSFPVGWLDVALRGDGPGLVYAVGAGMMTGAAPGYFSVMFNTQADVLDEALTRSLKVIDRIRTEPVDSATLQRARTAVLVSEALSRQTASQRAAASALDELYGLGYNQADRFIEELDSVTAADIQRVARKYLAEPVGVILSPKEVDVTKLPALSPAAPAAAAQPSAATPAPAETPAETQPKSQTQPVPAAN
jgi:zinc protease